MKRLRLGIITGIMLLNFTGCFEKEVTDEKARVLPVCVETSDNMYSMSQGTIGDVGDYYNKLLGKDTYSMNPIKNGKQLIFKVKGETILLDTIYQELEKGGCMEITKVKVTDKSGSSKEATPKSDYRGLTKIAEYVFKF